MFRRIRIINCVLFWITACGVLSIMASAQSPAEAAVHLTLENRGACYEDVGGGGVTGLHLRIRLYFTNVSAHLVVLSTLRRETHDLVSHTLEEGKNKKYFSTSVTEPILIYSEADKSQLRRKATSLRPGQAFEVDDVVLLPARSNGSDFSPGKYFLKLGVQLLPYAEKESNGKSNDKTLVSGWVESEPIEFNVAEHPMTEDCSKADRYWVPVHMASSPIKK